MSCLKKKPRGLASFNSGAIAQANGKTPKRPSCATTPCSRAASCERLGFVELRDVDLPMNL